MYLYIKCLNFLYKDISPHRQGRVGEHNKNEAMSPLSPVKTKIDQ